MSSMVSASKPHQFTTLDALRGVAALAVFQYHFFELFGRLVFSRGYLAVDFFFMLSGFVLAFAYQDRLDRGWTTFSFMKTRLVRLYPLYFLGLILGLLDQMTRTHFQKPGGLLWIFLTGSLLLPWVPGYVTSSFLFPLNSPAWSLFYELLANAGHACFLRRKNVALWVTAAIAAIGLMVAALRLGTLDIGPRWAHFPLPLVRVIFAYPAGMALFRIWHRARRRVQVPWIVPVALLGVALVGWGAAHASRTYDMAMVLVIFPVIVLLGASSVPPRQLEGLFRGLGLASYAIYILHFRLVPLLELVWIHVSHRTGANSAPWSGWVALAATVLFALLADRFYDLPARAWLRRRAPAAR